MMMVVSLFIWVKPENCLFIRTGVISNIDWNFFSLHLANREVKKRGIGGVKKPAIGLPWDMK